MEFHSFTLWTHCDSTGVEPCALVETLPYSLFIRVLYTDVTSSTRSTKLSMSTNASQQASSKRPLSPDKMDQPVQKHIKTEGSLNGMLVEPEPFCFLSLPGELRNRVYEMVVSQATDIYPVIAARSTQSNGAQEEEVPRQPPYGVNPCLVLTQVCRLIRREFQPVARTHMTTYIRPQTTRDYIQMLIDTDVESSEDSALKANIIVTMVGATGGKCIIDDVQSKMIDLCNNYPSTNIKFALPIYDDGRRPDKKRHINAILQKMIAGNLPLWNQHFSAPIKNVMLTVCKYREVELILHCDRGWPSVQWASNQLSDFVETLGLHSETYEVGIHVTLVGMVQNELYSIHWRN